MVSSDHRKAAGAAAADGTRRLAGHDRFRVTEAALLSPTRLEGVQRLVREGLRSSQSGEDFPCVAGVVAVPV